MPLWSQEDLEARMSRATLVQCIDPENQGEIDPATLARLQSSADAAVLSWLGGVFGVEALVESSDIRLVDLSLDYAVIKLAQRRAELFRFDWKDLYDVWRSEIEALRKGLTQLARDTAPNPASNTRAHLDSVSAGVGFAPCRIFNRPGGFGY